MRYVPHLNVKKFLSGDFPCRRTFLPIVRDIDLGFTLSWDANLLRGKSMIFQSSSRGLSRTALRHRAFVAAVSALMLAGSYEHSHAATLTWIGSAGDNNTVNPANWTPAQAPVNGDVLIYAGAAGLSPQMNSALTVGSLSFSSTAKVFTLGGTGTYTVNGGITNSSTSAETINTSLRLGANQNWNATSGNLTINGTLNLQTFTLTNVG